MLTRLAHFSIRTRDLEASRRFYVEALGLRAGARPPFAFPGLWLYAGPDETDQGVVHLIGMGSQDDAAMDAYLGARDGMGSGALDHVAFFADDWPAMRVRLRAPDIPYDERRVPVAGFRQVFVQDPCGVVIELNFAAGA